MGDEQRYIHFYIPAELTRKILFKLPSGCVRFYSSKFEAAVEHHPLLPWKQELRKLLFGNTPPRIDVLSANGCTVFTPKADMSYPDRTKGPKIAHASYFCGHSQNNHVQFLVSDLEIGQDIPGILIHRCAICGPNNGPQGERHEPGQKKKDEKVDAGDDDSEDDYEMHHRDSENDTARSLQMGASSSKMDKAKVPKKEKLEPGLQVKVDEIEKKYMKSKEKLMAKHKKELEEMDEAYQSKIAEITDEFNEAKKKLGDKSDKSEREKKKAELLQQLKDLEDSEGTDEMSPLKPSKKNKPTKKNNVKKSGLARIIVPNPKKKRRVEEPTVDLQEVEEPEDHPNISGANADEEVSKEKKMQQLKDKREKEKEDQRRSAEERRNDPNRRKAKPISSMFGPKS